MRLPSVRLGIDEGKRQVYQQVNIAGIAVFYADSVADSFSNVTIKVGKILFFNRLIATAK